MAGRFFRANGSDSISHSMDYYALYKKEKMRIKNIKVKIKNLDIIMPKVVKAYSAFYNS